MVYGTIAYYTELDLQICNQAQKQHIFLKRGKYAPGENCLAILAFADKLPTSATLDANKLSSF